MLRSGLSKVRSLLTRRVALRAPSGLALQPLALCHSEAAERRESYPPTAQHCCTAHTPTNTGAPKHIRLSSFPASFTSIFLRNPCAPSCCRSPERLEFGRAINSIGQRPCRWGLPLDTDTKEQQTLTENLQAVSKRAGRKKDAAAAGGAPKAGFAKKAVFESTKKKEVGVSDLTLLSKISNEAINENLKKRFENREIYVRVDPHTRHPPHRTLEPVENTN